MMSRCRFLAALLFVLAAAMPVLAVERFPPPDFTNHTLPEIQKPPPSRSLALEFPDVPFFLALLLLIPVRYSKWWDRVSSLTLISTIWFLCFGLFHQDSVMALGENWVWVWNFPDWFRPFPRAVAIDLGSYWIWAWNFPELPLFLTIIILNVFYNSRWWSRVVLPSLLTLVSISWFGYSRQYFLIGLADFWTLVKESLWFSFFRELISIPDLPPSLGSEYLDLVFLAVFLALATYLAQVRRSRAGLLLLTIYSLWWLGFCRKGCICSIGAIQNVSLALADPTYVIPFGAVAFFVLPILVALFFGRTFCAAVCPLGAIQEMAALKPIRVPAWIDEALGLIPFIYLGAAVLLAATGTTFLICSYDPFVGFFRLSAPQSMMILGICFLVVGVFVGRPYCRYLCPYGAILGLCSRWARWHVRIPPANCIQCRLCEEACPYGAIRQPTREMLPEEKGRGRRRLLGAFLLFPMLVGLGFVLGLGLGYPLARLHPTVRLAEYVYQVEKSGQEKTEETDPALKLRNDAVEAFRNTGRPPAALYEEASQHWFPLEVGKFLKCLLTFQFARAAGLLKTFHWLGGGLGAWAGLVIGIRLIALSLHRRRVDYEPDRANCVSCGRCFWYCPHEQVRLGLIDALPVVPADTEIKPPECTHL